MNDSTETLDKNYEAATQALMTDANRKLTGLILQQGLGSPAAEAMFRTIVAMTGEMIKGIRDRGCADGNEGVLRAFEVAIGERPCGEKGAD